MLIDSHAHLNFKAFDSDRDEVIERSLKNNVWLINASSNFNTSKLAVEIAEKYSSAGSLRVPGVYAAIGLHPIHVKDEQFEAEKYKQLAKSEKVVAIGETGLDYMYPSHRKQEEVFLQHLELAKELNLPVIFHCRKAHNEMIEILKKQNGFRGVVHCFTGKWQQAKIYLDMSLYLGFNGIIFKHNVDNVIKKMPLNRILIETDCPYLTPLPATALTKAGPKAGVDRNEPIYVKYVAERIAELRGESFEKIAQATTQNAKEFFGLK